MNKQTGLKIFFIFLPFCFINVFFKFLGHSLAAWACGLTIHHIGYSGIGFGCFINKPVNFFIGSAGILLPLIVGIIFFFLFKKNRKKSKQDNLDIKKWIFVFFSLFWLRPAVSIILYILNKLITIQGFHFIYTEVTVARIGNLPEYFILLILGVLSYYFIYKTIIIISESDRKKLLLGGFPGIIIGTFVWMKLLGPYILP